MRGAARDPGLLPIHRNEALTDGIFAVAMTLLVFDLKLPDHVVVRTSADLAQVLADLLPKAVAWLMSFFVLALFWTGHHRIYSHLEHADRRLVRLNMLQLAFVSLMPFSSSLLGKNVFLAQAVYSVNTAAVAILSWMVASHVRAHPGLVSKPISNAQYRGARLRLVGLIVVSAVAAVIAFFSAGSGRPGLAFLLMLAVMPWSRAIERREPDAAAPGSIAAARAPSAATSPVATDR